jgi:hypothetical protein
LLAEAAGGGADQRTVLGGSALRASKRRRMELPVGSGVVAAYVSPTPFEQEVVLEPMTTVGYTRALQAAAARDDKRQERG